VFLLGFGEFERHALASYVRLSGARLPKYEQAGTLEDADFVIADADHPGAIDVVLSADRVADTVFIGSLAPDRALGWAMRPIDPLQVFRELDAAVAVRDAARAPPQAPAPVAPPATAPGALDAPQRRAGDVATPLAALVVDDSELAQRSLQRQLTTLGFRSAAASTSTRALQLMAHERFDAVFIDADLGPASDLDGLALCQHLKRSHRPPGTGLAPRVVIVSSRDSPTDRVRGTFAGCDGYLAKPLDDDALRRQLRQVGLLQDDVQRPRRRREASPSHSRDALPSGPRDA
jgi:CheY-like chemotaxis protein